MINVISKYTNNESIILRILTLERHFSFSKKIINSIESKVNHNQISKSVTVILLFQDYKLKLDSRLHTFTSRYMYKLTSVTYMLICVSKTSCVLGNPHKCICRNVY